MLNILEKSLNFFKMLTVLYFVRKAVKRGFTVCVLLLQGQNVSMYHHQQQQQMVLGSNSTHQEPHTAQNPFAMPQASIKGNPMQQVGQQYFEGMGVMGRGMVGRNQFMANQVSKTGQDFGGFPQQTPPQQQQVSHLYSQVCKHFLIEGSSAKTT